MKLAFSWFIGSVVGVASAYCVGLLLEPISTAVVIGVGVTFGLAGSVGGMTVGVIWEES